MIPKIIHYCWLSGDPFPAEIQRCIDSWHKYLPDYELRLWDTKRFDIESTLWTKQAFEHRKYAFAADYIRLYALYNYGGIYLDADVLVYKSFDDLLQLPYFIGCDQIGAFEAAVIGAEKGCPWITDILEHYNDRPFIKGDGAMDMQELPITFHHELVARDYTFHKVHGIEEFVHGSSHVNTDSQEKEICVRSTFGRLHGKNPCDIEKRIAVFDAGFFNSRDQVGVRRTRRSYCAHNYVGSWQPRSGFTPPLWNPKRWLPRWLVNSLLELSHKTWTRHKFDWYTIPFG